MKNYLSQIPKVRLLVVGDVMLDQYWFGDVARISPEAPVPIVKVARSEIRLGGAANVARNSVALGAQSTLLSVVGDDEAGHNLHKLAQEGGIDAALHIDLSVATIVKLRVIGRQQQLLRIDFETPPSNETLKAKLDDFSHRLNNCDVVLLSDYGKGALTHASDMIARCRAANKAVFIDPKGDDYRKYQGATLLTPNRSELMQVVGQWHSEADLERRARELRADLQLEALLVTRSEEGMTLFTGEETVHQRAEAKEVYDVSGAGDTVISSLAVMRAAGADWRDAMRIATVAASIVVGKLGTAVAGRDEILAAL